MLKHTLLLPFLFLGLFLNAQTTVVDIVVGSDDHNTLEAAVVAAELADDLSGDGPFTLFAPTDAAFEALPEGTVETLLADPTGDLADILLYHALGAEVLSTSLEAEQTVTMLNGDEATVTVSDSTVMINGVATVIAADITADNGVVHVIDAVLLPPADAETNTVADIIAGSADHFVLNSVLDSTGLDEVLAGEGPFTVFAPVDAAFDQIPPFVLLDLLTNNEALTEILTYHVADGNVQSSDLSDGQTITTVNGEDVTVSIMGTTVMINNATVIVADLVADNGVVHVIDAVLSLPSGVDRVQLTDLFNVYPNPTVDAIRWDGVQVDRLQIVDAQGRTRIETTNPANSIDLSSLETGMFYLVIEADGQRAVKSVLKH